jgi:hypothetical protein
MGPPEMKLTCLVWACFEIHSSADQAPVYKGSFLKLLGLLQYLHCFVWRFPLLEHKRIPLDAVAFGFVEVY